MKRWLLSPQLQTVKCSWPRGGLSMKEPLRWTQEAGPGRRFWNGIRAPRQDPDPCDSALHRIPPVSGWLSTGPHFFSLVHWLGLRHSAHGQFAACPHPRDRPRPRRDRPRPLTQVFCTWRPGTPSIHRGENRNCT